jgi:hypothetical protein
MRSIGTDEIAAQLKRVIAGATSDVVRHADCG